MNDELQVNNFSKNIEQLNKTCVKNNKEDASVRNVVNASKFLAI